MDSNHSISIKIWLDEELQIIRQVLSGNLTEEAAKQVSLQTEACVTRLKDPGNVGILVDGRMLGKGDYKARKFLADDLKRPNFKSMAFLGGSPMMRTFMKFFNLIMGQDKIGFFKNEAEAIAWLIKPAHPE